MLAKMPPARNCSRMVELTVMDGTSEYYLFMGKAVICSVKSFTKGLWFSMHYTVYATWNAKNVLPRLVPSFRSSCLDFPVLSTKIQHT